MHKTVHPLCGTSKVAVERMDFFVIRRFFAKWKPVEIALLLAMGICLLAGGLLLKEQERLAGQVIRLHVLANSDTEADQALKLQVRDAVLAETERLLDGVESRQEAEMVLRDHLPQLEKIAQQEVNAAKAEYAVWTELEMRDFPTKEYDGFALPAGEYLALRVLIGEGNGQNWWCVAFPPLCTVAASDVAMTALAAGMDEEDVRLIMEEDGYLLKFKCVEWWQMLRRRLENK